MTEPRYTVEYDSRIALYRWQIAPGEQILRQGSPGSARSLRVVAIGGGTGLPVVLRGLKTALFRPGGGRAPGDRERLTAVVTVADDGGSSGRLRRAYHVLPPGDIRNCLLALSEDDPTMSAVFNFRFEGASELEGHSLGNLILTALSRIERDVSEAVERGGEILGIRGRVLPSTLDDVALEAEFEDGSRIRGESQLASVRRPIRQLFLEPAHVRALPEARLAVANADLLVIGPGSLYSSIITVLLLKDLADEIAQSRARVVLVMNLMTEPGETDGYTAADHLLAIRRHAPQVPVHHVLLNATPIPEPLLERYLADGAAPVRPDTDLLRAMGYQPVERDLLGPGPLIRHDPHKLAQTLLELAPPEAA